MSKNRSQRIPHLIGVFLSFFLLLTSSGLTGNPALAYEAGSHVSITNQEIARNGGFNLGQTAWYIYGSGSYVHATAGQDGGPALIMNNITGDGGDYRAFAVQELHLPSQTTAASYAFDFRLVKTYGSFGGLEAYIYKGTSLNTAAPILNPLYSTGWVNATISWQAVSGSLSQEVVSAIQTAHAAGEHVWFVVILYQSPAANQFEAHLDNLSLKVTGSMNYPTTGQIAYVGADGNGYAQSVNRIRPDGSSKQTVWTYPGGASATNHIYDVAWKPNAAEIAFSSNHENAYSAFNSDVYGIKPDGSGLRRITNPPSKAEIQAGGYVMGQVTGKVKNNWGSVTIFLLYIEGARNAISVDIGNYGDEVSFTVPEVADLGVGQHYVVFIWSEGTLCANGREYAAAVVDVQPGGSVDAGTLGFSGNCGTYESEAITWKRDGLELGVDVISPRRFLAAGQALGTNLFTSPLLANKPAWSPVDDRILYSLTLGGNHGIYRTTVGGGNGDRLVDTGSAIWVTPAWLPDGSGFVYTQDRQIRQHLFASSQDTLLAEFNNEYVENPSVSPDGNYVVFERRSTGGSPIQNDLWILNRSKPVEMWPATTDGRSSNPDWSRQDLPTGYYVFLPSISR